MNDIKKLEKEYNIIEKCRDALKLINSRNVYAINQILSDVKDSMKVESCSHLNTKTELSWDSHYDYEDEICLDCGKNIKYTKL